MLGGIFCSEVGVRMAADLEMVVPWWATGLRIEEDS